MSERDAEVLSRPSPRAGNSARRGSGAFRVGGDVILPR